MKLRDNDSADQPKAGLRREIAAGQLKSWSIGERFVLWALRQWRHEFDSWREAPGCLASESTLLRGFRSAGLVDAFPTFAMTMDAVLEGLTCSLEIHPPPCRRVSRDEAMLLALCGLAQGRIDRPLAASLATLLTPDVAVVVAERLTSFMTQLDAAGLRLVPMVGEGPGVLH